MKLEITEEQFEDKSAKVGGLTISPFLMNFLRNKRVLTKFKKNLRLHPLSWGRVGTVKSFVYSFQWSSTQEGVNFWEGLSRQFSELQKIRNKNGIRDWRL